jgi:hypothetical protein
MRAPLLPLVFAMCSCTGYQYIASPQYVPFNSNRGDLKANLSHNHVQVGYAVTNHVSVFATGYKRGGGTFINFEKWGKEGSGANTYADDSHEINIGTSYFKSSKWLLYELQAGGGFGHVSYHHDKDFFEDSYVVNMNAIKRNIFIQPSIAIQPPLSMRDFFQFGIFAKFVCDQYYNINVTSTLPRTYPVDKQDLYFLNRNSRNLYFAEPGVCVRSGSQWIKGNAIISRPFNLDGNNVRVRPLNIYLSFFLNFNLLKRR